MISVREPGAGGLRMGERGGGMGVGMERKGGEVSGVG